MRGLRRRACLSDWLKKGQAFHGRFETSGIPPGGSEPVPFSTGCYALIFANRFDRSILARGGSFVPPVGTLCYRGCRCENWQGDADRHIMLRFSALQAIRFPFIRAVRVIRG